MDRLKDIKDNVKKYVELARLLHKDPRTPTVSKLLLWVATGYALSPIDLIPDFIPVLGYLDDVIILPALLYISIKSIPEDVYAENYNRIFRQEVLRPEN